MLSGFLVLVLEYWVDAKNHTPQYLPQAAESTENLCYLCTNLINVYCRYKHSMYTVFSRFRIFVFQLFKMLGNTGMVAKATNFLYLEDEC